MNGPIATVAYKLAEATGPAESQPVTYFEGGLAQVTEDHGLKPLERGGFSYEPEFGDGSFSCDGKEIVIGGNAGEEDTCGFLSILDLETGHYRFFRDPGHHEQRSSSLPLPGLCPDGNAYYLENGEIVFGATKDEGPSRLRTYAIDSDGSHLHKLFDRPLESGTADGSWFLARVPRGVLVLDSKGHGIRAFPLRPYGGGGASISPNGRLIMYTASSPNHKTSNLFVCSRDGTHRRRLARSTNVISATFSPNGRWVAFTERWNGRGRENVFEFPLAKPSRVRRLTDLHGYWGLGGPIWAAAIG